jgi:hypothetical protein
MGKFLKPCQQMSVGFLQRQVFDGAADRMGSFRVENVEGVFTQVFRKRCAAPISGSIRFANADIHRQIVTDTEKKPLIGQSCFARHDPTLNLPGLTDKRRM